jgi:hypothetical protein
VASALRGDKDLGRGNLSGNVLADVGPAGVFSAASGERNYSATMPSFKHQAMVNLMGVKGSGAKKFFAEATSDIPNGMTADQYNTRMLEEIESALPKLKQTIGRFDLNAEEKVVYNAMIQRLSDARRQTYGDLHGIHSSLQIAPQKTMTPAAIAKMIAADELKRRQKGHSVSLSDNSFKTSANGFMAGGMIGNIFKGKAMHRIGAGYGPTGEPKPSMYESAPWGVNSLSIQMAETLFANTGLRKHTQKLFYDKFAAALAKEKPYGYLKDAQGSLKNALEPDVLDAVIRSAASNMISDRAVLKQMSPIDRDILRKKFLNWESKKDTPLTESLKQVIFGLEKREMGGPVNAGQPYVVGEKGPELFVPRNAGGIVPNNKYGIGGTIGVLAASIGPMMLASKVANPLLQTIMQAISFVIPQMIMTASMQRGSGKTGGMMSKIPASMKSPMGVFSEKTGGLTKYGTTLDNLTTSGSKFKNILGKIGMGLTRFNVGLAIGSVAVYAAVKAHRAHNEHLRIGMLQYGLTAAAAEKAGLKFTNYNDKLTDTVANIKALKERNQLLYESMQDAGTPISMTIEEYKKLRKEVKSAYADQIKLINQTKGDGNTKKLAQDLKIQLMAAGMSAEDATKKIWAMFKMSNKARDAASFTLGNSGFNKIETKQDAAARAVAGYSRSAAEGGREGAGSVNTGLTAIDAGIQDLIDKSKAANKKDKNKPILTEYEAQEKMLQRLNNLEASKAVLTRETINEMVKQNPELKKIINPMDTIVSLWGKMNLAAKGFTGDLSKLGAEAVSTLSKVADAISAATISENKEGLLKNQYDALERLTDQQKALMKAAKGQSAAQQINTREQLKGLQKQIDANNKLADARLKALDAAKQEGDIAREIAKKQAEYDSALATGNVAAAQQASLDIKGLQSDQQYNAQKKAIEDALKLKNAPLEAKIQAINDGQQKMSDKAALAGDSLSKLNDKIAKQRQKIDDVNLAMTSLRLNAAALGLTIDDYVKTYDGKKAAAAVVASANAVGVKIPTTAGSTGHPSSGLSSDVAAQALAIVNTTNDAVAKGLALKGIEVDGDIYINTKKMDVTPAKTPPPPGGQIFGNTMSTYKTQDMSLKEASKKAVTDKQSKQFTGAAGDQYYLFKYGQIVYAVDKTTGAVKLFDEATKTTGKVVKFAPGGKVFGAGSSTSDSIPAMLSDGEYVFSARAVNNAGGPDAVDNLHNALKRADGGPIASWMKPKSPYNSKNQPTGSPYSRYWGEMERLYQQSPMGFDKNGKPIFNNDGKDPWGGTEIPGLAFNGKVANFSDYFHQLAEQPKKSSGPFMGLDKSPDRYAGSGASMGGIGSGAYGLLNSLFMAEGGLAKKQNWFQRYVSGFNSKNTPAAEMFGTAQLLRLISGQNKGGDALGAAMLPLNFMGAGLGSKLGMPLKGLAGVAQASHINPVKASTQIMRNLNGSMLESAISQGRKVPTVVPDKWWANEANPTPYLEQFKDMFHGPNEMHPLLMASDYGAGFRKYWGRAYDSLAKSKDPALKGIKNVDEFFRSIAEKTPGWGSRYSEDATHPLVEAANKALMGAHGLAADQPIALFKAARQAGTAGYSSISSKFARGYLKNPHLGIFRDAAEGTEAGLYKIITEAKKLKDPLGLGGIYDEFANVIPQSLNNAIKIGSGTPRNASSYYGRPVNLADFYSALNLGKRTSGKTYGMISNSVSDLEEILSKMNPAELASKMKLPKFENGINSVPADMLAQLHKNEAVVPASMNPFNPNANNATMGATYNITNNINGYDGDLNQLSNMVTQKTITAITAIDKISSKMVGNPMTVSINK